RDSFQTFDFPFNHGDIMYFNKQHCQCRFGEAGENHLQFENDDSDADLVVVPLQILSMPPCAKLANVCSSFTVCHHHLYHSLVFDLNFMFTMAIELTLTALHYAVAPLNDRILFKSP